MERRKTKRLEIEVGAGKNGEFRGIEECERETMRKVGKQKSQRGEEEQRLRGERRENKKADRDERRDREKREI